MKGGEVVEGDAEWNSLGRRSRQKLEEHRKGRT
jgi:hypothetical protein